jgi:rhodanese-related sulfurtransferase
MPTVIDRRRVQELVEEGAHLIEVLGPKEYDAEHLPGAINIPLKALGWQATKLLDARRPVIPYCHDYQ